MPTHELVRPVVHWYRHHARDLPWRSPSTTPWGVMVSEFMLQQTPVDRVLPVYDAWMLRWPDPAALAAAPSGDAVRMWGRLGYPRRAVRLHAAAREIVDEHDGVVPRDPDVLRTLPGVGNYTAAAIAAFAFGTRVAVLDTNVRRVHARVLDGSAFPRSTSVTVGERERALALLPRAGALAAEASVAVMELGALVCTARTPRCNGCPLARSCAWLAAGLPPWDGPVRRGQTYAGTDRQCRGALLGVVRDATGPVHESALRAAWPTDELQFFRALDGLVADGLVEPQARHRYALPS